MPQEAILQKYPWAINSMKVARAVQVLNLEVTNKLRKDYSDEEVKELYVKYGGALTEDAAVELTERAKYLRNAGGIGKIVENAAGRLTERASKLVKKAPKKAE